MELSCSELSHGVKVLLSLDILAKGKKLAKCVKSKIVLR